MVLERDQKLYRASLEDLPSRVLVPEKESCYLRLSSGEEVTYMGPCVILDFIHCYKIVCFVIWISALTKLLNQRTSD
jgi:hypothetical protein